MGRQTYHWNDIRLTPEQTAQVLWQAGFRDANMIAQLVSIAKRESGYQAGIHGSDSPKERVSGDRGLFQINASAWDKALKQAGIIQNATDLFDPVVNAKAAYFITRNGTDWGALKHAWGWSGGTWNGSGTLPAPNMQAVQTAQASGLIGQPYQTAPGAITSGAASGAAGPGSNPGTGELGFVNANAQNQRDYYNQQMGYLGEIYKLGDKRSALEFTELEANRVYQLALQGVYEDVNRAKGVFNTKEWNNLKTSLNELKSLQDAGFSGSNAYHAAQRKLEQQVYSATIGYLNKQKTTAAQTNALAKAESAFVFGENVRKRSGEAITKGARLAEGTSKDMSAFARQRELQDIGSTIQYDAEGNRIANERTQAQLGYLDQQQDRNWQQNQFNLQYRQNLSDLRSREREGSLRYQQTSKELWAKAKELEATRTLNKKLIDNQYQGIRIGRDIDYKQYQQSHHSLSNQFQQVGVNQVRDIQELNQRRQAAANQALLSLSPYG